MQKTKRQQLSDALDRNDLPVAYSLSTELQKGRPLDQQLIKIRLFSCKHDRHLFPDVYSLKDTVQFPSEISEPIDFEALLMLVDIIEAIDSLVSALDFVSQYVDRVQLSEGNRYTELFFSTMAVKFADFNEPELAFRYHTIALKYGGTYISKYNLGHSRIRFGQYLEALEYYDSRWEWPTFPSTQRSFSIPQLSQGALRSDCKILVWAEQGIGDQILWSQAIKVLIDRGFGNLTLEVHRKLVPLMSKSFPSVNVIAQPVFKEQFDSSDSQVFNIENYDYQVSLVNLFLMVNESLERFVRVEPFLATNDEWAHSLRSEITKIQPGKKIVGLHWSSSALDPVRARAFLIDKDLEKLAKLNSEAVFVSFNYAATESEVERLRDEIGLNIISVSGINHKEQVMEATALLRACDFFLGVTGSVTWQATFVGVPTILVEFSSNPNSVFPRPDYTQNFKRILGRSSNKSEAIDYLVENFKSVCLWSDTCTG